MKTSIIIPLFNKVEFTEQCLESLDAYTKEEHEIIFINNGSTDDTRSFVSDWATKRTNAIVIENETNLGFPKAVNQGIAFATGDYICVLNNDVIVSREWLKGLIECLESSKDIAIVGPRTNNISGPQQFSEPCEGYDTIMKFQEFAVNFRNSFRMQYTPYWRIVGFCMLFRKSLIDEIGNFDEQFTPGNFEDDDFCRRAVQSGYRNLICGDVFVHHHGSASHDMSQYNDLLRVNEKKFQFKWRNYPKTISACMIVKNEEANIKRCLDSIHPHVDEIVIVDTGSTDKTIDICKQYEKVKVYNFTWTDDFSEARQFANDHATMGWILSIDADEVMTGLDVWKQKLQPFYAYRICTRNYTHRIEFANLVYNKGEYEQEEGVGWFPSVKIRLWPRDERVRWEYPVHEVVENSVYHLGMGLLEPSDLIVHHYGRMDDKYEKDRAEKYYDYLHKQWKSGKNDLRSLEQLATQAQAMERWEDAVYFWNEVIKLEPDNNDAPLNLCHVNAKQEKWEEAHKWATRRLMLMPENRDSLQNLAYTSYMMKDYVMAVTLAKKVLKMEPNQPVALTIINLCKEKI